MRFRNVKNKEEILLNSDYVLKDGQLLKGNWQEKFNNNNPIYIEIGTGKCKFIFENALKYPSINFIGIEKFSSVLAQGIKEFENIKLDNLFLVNDDASKIEDYFDKEIDLIYLNFSDPWPKKRHFKRRLTSWDFLRKYDNIFKKDCVIIQKTDNQELFAYSISSLSKYGYIMDEVCLDLHNDSSIDNISTEYEIKFVKEGKKIYRLKAFKNSLK